MPTRQNKLNLRVHIKKAINQILCMDYSKTKEVFLINFLEQKKRTL